MHGNLASAAAPSLALPAPSTFAQQQFVATFNDSLIQAVREQNPPVYDGLCHPARDCVLDGLKRKPFEAQRNTVRAVSALLVDADELAAVINAEMGTGKTMMRCGQQPLALFEADRFARCLGPAVARASSPIFTDDFQV